MGKENGVVVQRTQTSNYAVAARSHFVGGLASRGRRVKDRPSGFRFTDLFGCDPFILTVVPLGKVIGNLGTVEVTGQFTGAPCPLPRAAEHELEIPSGEFSLERRRLALSLQG